MKDLSGKDQIKNSKKKKERFYSNIEKYRITQTDIKKYLENPYFLKLKKNLNSDVIRNQSFNKSEKLYALSVKSFRKIRTLKKIKIEIL